MRIVIDLQACQASSANRGIGRYSMALAQAMARRARGHELQIVLNSHFPETVDSVRKAFAGLLDPSHILCFDLPSPLAEYDRRNHWRMQAAEQLREHFLAGLQPDVVHVASLFEGLGDNAAASVEHGDGSFDTAVTLYDLIPLLRKEKYLTEPHVAAWYYRKLQSLKNAELLLAISGHSRREAMDALQLPGERVVNISSAVDDMFRPRDVSPDEAAALRARYGLTRPFIMYTGGIDYRKNIEGLIEAFALLAPELRRQYQLAIVCSIHDPDRMRLERMAARLRLAPDELVLTGFVSDADLVTLYNLTSLFVFPSLQEGFGLPALEAMRCGAPVIGSDSSSIPEVIGRADALFDPTRIDAIGAAMTRVLTQPDFAASLRAHGLEQGKLFSWDASAQVTLEAFEAMHERHGAERAHARTLAVKAPARRRRLAYISPLPPERSGIADYSAELLPELARFYDIDVIVAQDTISDDWVASNYPRRTAAWFDANAAQFDRILYHFGNSSFHAHMFGLLERHPGVVVLHDFYLSGVRNYLEAAATWPNAYCCVLYGSHGYVALRHELEKGREASLYGYPCNRDVLRQATGVIVHSTHAIDLARQWYGPDLPAAWRMVPLLRVLPAAPDRVAARRALGIPDDAFLLCSFGLLGLTKCNDKIVEAWLNSALGSDPNCHLVFVGENNILQFGRDLVARIADHPRIRITGFASQALYRQYLAAADAAVQLRTHSRGETSATVLDCLAWGLPTIINAHGSAAEVADDVAIKLPDAFSERELSAAILALRDDPDAAQALALRGRAYMERLHHPARIGEQYRDLLENFAHEGGGARHRQLLQSLAAIGTEARPDAQDMMQVAACMSANGGSGDTQLLIDVTPIAYGGTPPRLAQLPWRLARHLLLHVPPGYRVEPVRQDGSRYRYARRYTLDRLIDRPELHIPDEVADLFPTDSWLEFADGVATPAARTLSNRGLARTQIVCAPATEAPFMLPVAVAAQARDIAGAGAFGWIAANSADAPAAWLTAYAGAPAATPDTPTQVLVVGGADNGRRAAVESLLGGAAHVRYADLLPHGALQGVGLLVQLDTLATAAACDAVLRALAHGVPCLVALEEVADAA